MPEYGDDEKVVWLDGDMAAEHKPIPEQLREMADDIEAGEVRGTGMICVLVQPLGYPDVYGYGNVGNALVELELARMQLFKFYLGDHR